MKELKLDKMGNVQHVFNGYEGSSYLKYSVYFITGVEGSLDRKYSMLSIVALMGEFSSHDQTVSQKCINT